MYEYISTPKLASKDAPHAENETITKTNANFIIIIINCVMYENINLLQLLLLKAIAFIYLSSFTSWYIQIPSLYGQNGLLPVRHFIHKVPTNKF